MSTKPLAEVEPAVGVRGEAGRKNGAQPYCLIRPHLNPSQMASHRMGESGDASAVSHSETGASITASATEDGDQSPRMPYLSEGWTFWPGKETAGVADAMIKAAQRTLTVRVILVSA